MEPIGWQYFLPPLVLLLVATGVLIYRFGTVLRERKEEFMASFHIRKDSAITDFRMLAVSIFLYFNGFAVSLADYWLDSGFLTSLGRISWLMGGIMSFTVALRWWVKIR